MYHMVFPKNTAKMESFCQDIAFLFSLSLRCRIPLTSLKAMVMMLSIHEDLKVSEGVLYTAASKYVYLVFCAQTQETTSVMLCLSKNLQQQTRYGLTKKRKNKVQRIQREYTFPFPSQLQSVQGFNVQQCCIAAAPRHN